MTEQFLEHYGVKGMKWGVRKESSGSGGSGGRVAEWNAKRKAPTDVQTTQKPGQFVRSTGGRNQSASSDAVVAQTYRQKARASTTDALSNKELQDLVQRMNLESQYTQLILKNDRRSKGKKFFDAIVKGEFGKDSLLNNEGVRDMAVGKLSARNPSAGAKAEQVSQAMGKVYASNNNKKKKK